MIQKELHMSNHSDSIILKTNAVAFLSRFVQTVVFPAALSAPYPFQEKRVYHLIAIWGATNRKVRFTTNKKNR